MKIAVYARVSTDRQSERGQGLDVQIASCRAWATAHGHTVVEVLRERGVSGGKELEGRPALAEAFALLRRGDVGGILVARLDRLARDLILQEQLLADIRRRDGQLFTAAEGEAGFLADDPDDPSRRLIRQILGSVAEYERSMIALRLRSGRRAKAAKGGYAYGAPPFGLSAKDGKLVADEDEAKAVKRILELSSAGHSLREIIATLEAEKIQPKRKKGQRRWHPQTVARVISRGPVSTSSAASE